MTIAVTCCLRFSSDNTCEPLEHLNCHDLVKQFEEGRNSTPKKKTVDEMVYFLQFVTLFGGFLTLDLYEWYVLFCILCSCNLFEHQFNQFFLI